MAHPHLAVLNVCFASICCAALAGAGLAYATRVLQAHWRGKEWSGFQRRAAVFVCAQLGVQALNAGGLLRCHTAHKAHSRTGALRGARHALR